MQRLQNLQLKLKQNQELKPNNSSQDTSDSYITSTDNLSFEVDSDFHPTQSNNYKLLSIIICTVFLIVFGIDSYLDSRLHNLKVELTQKEITNDQHLDIETKYISVAHSLDTYKMFSDEKTSIYPKVQLIYTALPEEISLDEISISDTTFKISLSSTNVILISQFLAGISRNPVISSVILESANLNSGTSLYTVDVRGTFR